MAKLTTEEFIAAIKELSVLELNDLVKACEEEFGVSAAAGVVVAAAGAAESGSGNGSATAANRRTGAEAGAFPILRTPSAGSTGRGHGEDLAAACESGHRLQGADHGAGQSDR